MSEEFAEFFLKKPDWNLGEWVGDPAGGDGDGNVATKFHGHDGGKDHLPRDGEHGREEADGEAGGDWFAVGVPEVAVKDGGDEAKKPRVAFEARATQQAEGAPDEAKVASFESGGHIS